MIKEGVFNLVQNFDLPIDRIVQFGNKDFIPFGADNLFPQQIAKLCRESVNHRAIINSKALYIGGKKITSESEKTQTFIDSNKFHNEYSKILLDYLCGGNGWIEIIKDSRNNLLKIYHQDYTKVRLSKPSDSGVVKTVIINNDWQKYKKENSEIIGLYPNFTKGADGFLHSIFQVKDYEPEFNYYGVPNWYAGLKAARISKKTNEFNDERLSNKFAVDGILTIPGISSIDDAEKFENKLNKYKGAENGGKVITHYLQPLQVGESREDVKFTSLNENSDGVFMDLHKQSNSDLITIHSWYKSLAAFDEATGFDTKRILNDYNMAFANVIKPMQEMFLNIFNEIFKTYGLDEIAIENQQPIYEPTGVEYVWEVRQAQGLSYDENDPRQQVFYQELIKGGSNGFNVNSRG